MSKTVALCVIATGRYDRFVEPLAESLVDAFLPDCPRTLFLFTDTKHVISLPTGIRCLLVPARHEPWPGVTLHRYRTMLTAREGLENFDYVYYMDVDFLCVGTVGPEIFGPLVAVRHPGFAGRPRCCFTYETRPSSLAYVGPDEGTTYFAGGFQGGESARYCQAMEEMDERIMADELEDVTAVWHDESHWNRYLIDNPPAVVLGPEYCCPESWAMEGRKLLALDKNHAEIRA